MRDITQHHLPTKKFQEDSLASPLWRVVTRIEICSNLNHREVKKGERSRLFSLKLTASRELLLVVKYISEEKLSS